MTQTYSDHAPYYIANTALTGTNGESVHAFLRQKFEPEADYGLFSALFMRERTGRINLGPAQSPLWRLLPIIAFIGMFVAPALSVMLGRTGFPFSDVTPQATGPIAKLFAHNVGSWGAHLAACLAAALTGLGIWLVGRVMGAPRWAVALAATLFLVAPFVGAAVWPGLRPDDAVFAGLMLLALFATLHAISIKSVPFLALALALATVACWVRPWAIWPILAVFLSVVGVTRKFGGRPYYMALTALSWGPGMVAAANFGANQGFRQNASGAAHTFAERVHAIFNANASHLAIGAHVQGAIWLWLPILALAILAGAALYFLFRRQQEQRNLIAAATSFAIIAALGAIGYGNVSAARLLLTPLVLALLASIGGLALAWWQQRQQARPTAQKRAAVPSPKKATTKPVVANAAPPKVQMQANAHVVTTQPRKSAPNLAQKLQSAWRAIMPTRAPKPAPMRETVLVAPPAPTAKPRATISTIWAAITRRVFGA